MAKDVCYRISTCMTYGMTSVFFTKADDWNETLITSKLLSALLLLAVSALVLTPMAGSQSLTTITSLTTATSLMKSTSYHTFAVQTTTATSTVTSAIYTAGTFTVQGVKPRQCFGTYFTYDALAGEKLQGKWTSNYVINFYVMPESSYAKFKYCGQPGSTYITMEMATSYSLSWVVPTDGRVYFYFENYASGSDTASARTVTFELYKIGPASRTSLIYSTTSAQMTLESTAILTSVLYSTLNQPVVLQTGTAAPSMSPTALMIIGIVIGIIAVAVIVAISKRKRATATSSKTPLAEKREERGFCINCGAELPPSSKFCNKCGSSQP
jgi:ribosomal protein L40E